MVFILIKCSEQSLVIPLIEFVAFDQASCTDSDESGSADPIVILESPANTIETSSAGLYFGI